MNISLHSAYIIFIEKKILEITIFYKLSGNQCIM